MFVGIHYTTAGHVIAHWSLIQNTFGAQDQFSSEIIAPDVEQTDGSDGERVSRQFRLVNSEPGHDSAQMSAF